MSKLLQSAALIACMVAGCDPPPPVASPSTVASVDGSALPGASADAEPIAKTAAPNLRIECECRTGPIPAPPGKSPVTSRRVVVEPDGAVKKTTLYLAGPALEATSKLAPAALEALNDLARKVFIKKTEAGAAEQPVPDGMVCVLRISEGAPMLTIQSPHPSSRPHVAPLVEALVRLLPPV